jgi:hypothetical protein
VYRGKAFVWVQVRERLLDKVLVTTPAPVPISVVSKDSEKRGRAVMGALLSWLRGVLALFAQEHGGWILSE